MLPVVSGARATRLQIFIYTLILWPAALAPTFLGTVGSDLWRPPRSSSISASRRWR